MNVNDRFVFFFKQKTAYEMRISDWSSDVCSSDLLEVAGGAEAGPEEKPVDADQRLVPRLQRRVERDRLRAGVLHVDLQVVLQVLADARQVVRDGDALRLQFVGRADAGQQQHLRRVDGAAGADQIGRAACRERVGQ